MWNFDVSTISLRSFFGIGAFARRPVASADAQMEAALKELASFEDYQLNDIGLCRSDLTPEGLTIAGMRRRLEQARMDAEHPAADRFIRRVA
jgi:hypothetical protein